MGKVITLAGAAIIGALLAGTAVVGVVSANTAAPKHNPASAQIISYGSR